MAFLITKQTHDRKDFTCGIHCVAAVARDLGALRASGDPVGDLLDRLPSRLHTRITGRAEAPAGLHEKDLRALAAAAGLSVYRPNRQSLDQFNEPDWKWIALVKLRFEDPQRQEDSYEANHYVVVLRHDAAKNTLTVADPHPWRQAVYDLPGKDFEQAWRKARPNRPPWSACLYIGG